MQQARPLTWLLLTVAAWALLAWVLTLFGLGQRLPLADDKLASAEPLPLLGAAPEQRLSGPGDYAESVRRPLFFASRRPVPFVLGGGDEPAEADNPFDFVLTGVLIAPGVSVATLQEADGSTGPRVRVGQDVPGHPGWRLLRLSPRMAVFTGPEGETSLELRKFTGEGAQLPTPMRVPPAPPAPAAPTAASASAAAADAARAAAQAAAEAAAQTAPSAAAAAQSAGGVAPATHPSATPAPPAPSRAAPQVSEAQQAQVDAIRRRIEARRAELQQRTPQQTP